MYLSIVIPTLGRTTELVEAIRSIEPEISDDVELIIIDQNHEGFLEETIPDDLKSKVTIHRIDKKGSSKARNEGLALAKGKYINFCDDDAIIEPGLCGRIFDAFEHYSNAKMISFRVFDLKEDIVCKCLVPFPNIDCRINEKNYHLTTTEFSQVWVTSVIRELGGYDTQFGVGEPFGAEEGNDLVMRALGEKYTLFYVANTCFRHPSKKNASAKRCFIYAEGTAAFAWKHWHRPHVKKRMFNFVFRSIAGVFIYNIWKLQKARCCYMRLVGVFSGLKRKAFGNS